MKPVFKGLDLTKKLKASGPHLFWDKQPVVQGTWSTDVKEIDVYPLSTIPLSTTKLPDNFEWSEIDLKDEEQSKELFDFLKNNYLAEGKFSLNYTIDKLRWILLCPDYVPEWHICIRSSPKKNIVGVITATNASFILYGRPVDLPIINFLCVHKKYRSFRMAPILIQEITRRIKLKELTGAVYTAVAALPHAIAISRYHHRILNAKKLIEVGFVNKNTKLTLAGYIKTFNLSSDENLYIPKTEIFRNMTAEDVPQVCKRLNQSSQNII